MFEDRLAICLKISQPVWIEKLRNGEAWFGKIDNYIKQAEENNNNEQGDKFEGVFARCKRTSLLVHECIETLGDDLEIINDEDYCYLRRKSCRLLKAFCLYGIRNSDLEITGVLEENDITPKVKFHYDIAPKMYNDFLQDGSSPSEVAGLYASAGHINEAIEKTLNTGNYRWKRNVIKYDIDITSEFCLDISDDYPELWHKRKDLSYQHESRIVIYDFDDSVKGLIIKYNPVGIHSANCAKGQLYLEGTGYAACIK